MKRSRAPKRSRTAAEADLVRFGISIPADLLKDFDKYLTDTQKANRSDAIRLLIRDRLTQEAWASGKGEQLATLTLVYDAQNQELMRRLSEQKRELGSELLSALQVHVSAHQELEVLALRGAAAAIRTKAEAIMALKGILHAKMVMTVAAAERK